jgi:hypothetical protein
MNTDTDMGDERPSDDTQSSGGERPDDGAGSDGGEQGGITMDNVDFAEEDDEDPDYRPSLDDEDPDYRPSLDDYPTPTPPINHQARHPGERYFVSATARTKQTTRRGRS